MSPFTVHLLCGKSEERLEGAVAFIGQDASGSFGILAHHERFMTFLENGLAKVRYASGQLEYLALPEALVYFAFNELRINTRAYVKSADYRQIAQALELQLSKEDDQLKATRESLRKLDEELLKRLWKVKFTKG